MRRIKAFATIALLSLGLATAATTGAHAQDNVITKPSAHDVTQTIDRLEAVLASKGITVFGRVDHAANAKKVGLEVPPTTLIIFGNPKLGTPLMASNRAIGLDLPMKALAWQDKDGKVYLSYTAPAALKARFAISDRDQVFTKMTGALDKFTTAATASGDLTKGSTDGAAKKKGSAK